jgi:type IV fimbrial biogenesis protein FimT
MKKKSAGFTLFEIVITVAVVSVFTAITLPNLMEWVQGYQISNTAQQIAMELRLARTKAVSESRNVNFIVVPGKGCNASYQIVPDGPVRSVAQSISIRGVAGDNPLVFNSRGQASDDTTVIIGNRKSQLRAIRINVAGRVEVISYAGKDEFEGSFDEI